MSLKHSLLALLADNPASGYDLSQQFKGSVGFFWNASHQQIYKELKAMAGEGWLSFDTQVQTDRPDRKIYQITPTGQQALEQWLLVPVKSQKYKDALLIKIYAGRHMPSAALIAELQQHIKQHSENLQKLQAIETDYQDLSAQKQANFCLPYLTLKLGISNEKNWLNWAQETLEQLRATAG